MSRFAFKSSLFAVAGMALSSPSAPAFAQDVQEEDDAADAMNTVIVTGARIRQGGAQDINHFRSMSLDGSFLPHANSLTLEGLMGEHDLALPSGGPCEQLFCLNAHSTVANLPTRPDDDFFVGLGFDSNIDADDWRGEPLSLVAVVDRSGSMEGSPIARVKESLTAALGQMRKDDRMGIVIYGSDTVVHLPVTEVEGNRSAIREAIDSIEINGSTYMEAGLKLGYSTAFEELANSGMKTRVMLFTDENPNVGNTSPEGFMGMARAASERGIGLTTIGVGVHFDGALATKVSSVRGGNLFFVDRAGDAGELFKREYFNMVSEVAHDIEIAMTPAKGYKITGVFGVPDEMMEDAPDGTVKITVGTAFLSSNGGGIYASLGKESGREFLPAVDLPGSAPLMDVSLAYVDARSGTKGSDKLAVAQPEAKSPERLLAVQALVDQYLTITDALALYHDEDDRKGAFAALDGLSGRLSAGNYEGFAKEMKLVSDLRERAAYMAGYSGEMPKSARPLALVGEWRVLRQSGLKDIARGDYVELTEDGEFITYRERGPKSGEEIYQDFQVNERHLRIVGERLVFSYSLNDNGSRLRLSTRDGETLVMERES